MSLDQSRESGEKAPRYQMLDVWRGLVCLVVVLEHVGVPLWAGAEEAVGWEGGVRWAVMQALRLNVGSPLFFVMSGYCIASCLDSARRRGTSPAEFLLKRVWRIFPTYWAALFGFVAVVAVLDTLGLPGLHRNAFSLEIDAPGDLTFAQWLGNLTLTETWRPLLGGGSGSVYTRVAWSLCYQEQFYAVCALVLWLAPGRLDRVLAAASVAIVGFHLAAWDVGAGPRIEGTFPVYWHVFAVGLAVYWRLNRAPEGNARRGVELGLAGLIVVGWATSSVATTASAGFGILLIALHRWDRRAGQLGWLDPVRAIGRRSYSIYLIHLPVTTVGNALLAGLGLSGFWPRVLVMVPVVTGASVAVGWAFYRAVECRFLGPPPLPRKPGVAVAVALAPA